ncbi:neurofilament medium polypeptide isoform X2 [Drosophila pseudoobscura]|uniref:Neurofilament medium polypeptide isoform X2 n=1 Tax=Drosophila pseudoobscura pseudoobscura TaxID=46245 RepID=A0A6I8UIS6_DROPS|nr:neurofilament medium polypeptide isoform X2 [Drosophila pseudoobscura]
MEARALSEGQVGIEMSKEFIQFGQGSPAGLEEFGPLTEKSPRAMQNQEQEKQIMVEAVEAEEDQSSVDGKQESQDCAENDLTNAEPGLEIPVEKSSENYSETEYECSSLIEIEIASEESKEETLTAEERAKMKEKEAKEQAKKESAMAKEERKLKEKQLKEAKRREKLNVLLEEARSLGKSPKPEVPATEASPEAKPQSPPGDVAGAKKKTKKAKKAAKWRVDSAKMEEDIQQFLEAIKALEKKQREADRQEAEEAAAIVIENEHMRGWNSVLKELGQTSTFSAATASLSAAQLSSAPRLVVRAILHRVAKMEYKNQLHVLEETYQYRSSLLKRLKLDMRSNYKRELQELSAAYKKSKPQRI